MSTTFERRLGFEGSPNFRDLGGYPALDGGYVRWRKIYRSDAMVRVTDADAIRMDDLGLRTMIDLRTTGEISKHGVSRIHQNGIVRCHVPLLSDERYQALVTGPDNVDLYDLYVHILEDAGPGMRQVFETLVANDNYPVVFHCSLGKDRTGVVSALVLRALGVDDATIVEDFALSGIYITPYLESWADEEERAGRKVNRSILQANADAMERMLNHLDERYGTGTAYHRAIGISDQQITTLRDQLLE